MTIRVLVVDDSALMRKAITSMLVDAGDFEVHLARNGLDALDQLARVEPDVVTLDVNMPEMDGLTCLAELMRERPTPVVMVSSLTEEGALTTLEALELGAVDFLEKPGGTVSLNMQDVADALVEKVRRAARARVRAGSLAARVRRARERSYAAARAHPDRAAGRDRATGDPAPGDGGGEVDLLVVGASTGGPALLADLLAQLPARTGAAVLVVQHMPGSFTRPLAERLDVVCPLPVQEVTGLTPVEAGHVYLARGDGDMVVARRTGGLLVRPAPTDPAYRWHPSVDRLVESALETVDARHMVGVLLTGMGDDGAEQMARLHSAGGRTIAESEESAVVWGMPGQLVARGGATCVLPAEDIGARVTGWLTGHD